jgi:hypothetical protein
LVLRNRSNVSVGRAVVWLRVPQSAKVQVEEDPEPNLPSNAASLPASYDDGRGHRVVPLFVYNVGARQERIINVALTLTTTGPQDVSAESIVLESSKFDEFVNTAIGQALRHGWLQPQADAEPLQPAGGSPTGGGSPSGTDVCAQFGDDVILRNACEEEQGRKAAVVRALPRIRGLIKDAIGLIYGAPAMGGEPDLNDVKDLFEWCRDWLDILKEGTQWRDSTQQRIQGVGSRDPNDKIGPAGFGPSHTVASDAPLFYTVDFENVATASATAQRVRITDDLDSSIDVRTVRL